MGLFIFGEQKEKRPVLHYKDGYHFRLENLTIEDNAYVKSDNERRVKGWFLVPSLLNKMRAFGVDAMVTVVCDRHIRGLDLFRQLDPSWDDDKIWSKVTQIAKEQEHKAWAKPTRNLTAKATMWLSVAACLLFVAIMIIGFMKARGG